MATVPSRPPAGQASARRTKQRSGQGAISLSVYNDCPVLDRLEFTYSLKLVAPTPRRRLTSTSSGDRDAEHHARVATQVVYVLSYGGGLVGGDAIALKVTVSKGGVLGLSTQGSTKVFKHRPTTHQRKAAAAAAADESGGDVTRQSLDVTVDRYGTLLLVPDPVQPFADSRYVQKQRFELADASSSLLVLDWVVSGRPDNGERWSFTSYHSDNAIHRDGGRLLIRDCQSMRSPSTAAQMRGYDCLATVLLTGAAFERDADVLLCRFTNEERVRVSSKRAEELIWTVVKHRHIAVLKVAGLSSEQVREWLAGLADDLGWRERFGRDAFRAIER